MIFLTQNQAEEIRKCSEDALYFIKTYAYFKHPERGRLKYSEEIFEWQETLIKRAQAGESIMVLKSRRVGASTVVAAFIAWLLIFHINKECYFISQKELSAISLLKKVKYVISNLPEWLVGETGTDTKTQLSFIFRDDDQDSETYGQVIGESSVISLTTTSTAARGESASFIFCDEMGFWPPNEAEDMWTSIKPATSHGGSMIIASTPKAGNLFERLWFETKLKVERSEWSEFSTMEVHWKNDCHYSDEWFKKTTAGMTEEQIMQEMELNFVQSGNPVFYLPALNKVFKPVYNIRLSSMYYSGVDTSEGIGKEGDYNAIVVFNEHGEQVYCERNKLPLSSWAGYIGGNGMIVPGKVSTLHKVWPGIMVIETNGPGIQVYNMHVLPQGYCKVIPRKTTSKSKPNIIHQFALAVEAGKVIITDETLYEELRKYIHYVDGSMKAPVGGHDDLVMACFPEGYFVKTISGWKDIKDVVVGELVLTHKNRYRKVVMKNSRLEKNSLLKLKAIGKLPIITTIEHPFYSYKKYKPSGKGIKFHSPRFVAANDIRIGKDSSVFTIDMETYDLPFIDMLHFNPNWIEIENKIFATTINKSVRNGRCHGVTRFIELDDDFCTIIGYFAAEGNTNKSLKHDLRFASNIREEKITEFVYKFFSKHGVTVTEHIKNKGRQLCLYTTAFANFFRIFGSKDTKCYPAFVDHLPVDKQLKILAGHAVGDGSLSCGNLKIVTVSKKMALQLYTMFSRCGFTPSIGEFKNKNKSFIVSLDFWDTKDFINKVDIDLFTGKSILETKPTSIFHKNNIKNINNELISSFRNSEDIYNSETLVYNLTVDEDHSYVIDGYTVHNCLWAWEGFCMYGGGAEILTDIAGGSLYEYTMRPEYMSGMYEFSEQLNPISDPYVGGFNAEASFFGGGLYESFKEEERW